jgi:hypothetical protein
MEAERDLYAIWQPDEVWSRFIRDQLESDMIAGPKLK